MNELTLIAVFLAVISACLVTLTFLIVLAVRDFRRMTLRVHSLLALFEKICDEPRRMLAETRHLLVRTNKATEEIELFLHKTTDGASEAIHQFVLVKNRIQDFLKGKFRNGSKSFRVRR